MDPVIGQNSRFALACEGEALQVGRAVLQRVVKGDAALVAALDGDFDTAADLQKALSPLNELLFSQVNPIPVKAALYMMGMCSLEYRLPLSPPSNKTQYMLYEELRDYGLV